jgi:hypothetical protein
MARTKKRALATQVEPNLADIMTQRIMARRRSKLTPETFTTLLRAARAGLHRETQAKVAGISDSTLESWLAQGRERLADIEAHTMGDLPGEPPPFTAEAELAVALERAEGCVELEIVGYIMRVIGDESLKAASTYLGSRWPFKWGRAAQRLELHGEVKATVTQEETDPVAELADRVAIAIAKAATDPDPEDDPTGDGG